MKVSPLAALPLLFGALYLPASAAPQAPQGSAVVLTVSVFNDAAIPSEILRQAKSQAEKIFLQAGVQIEWRNCGPVPPLGVSEGRCSEVSFPTHLHLRILSLSRGLSPSTVGLSFLSAEGTGCYADLFYGPLLALRNASTAPDYVILGHAMAHELGHLLLGTNSHSSRGLMREHWDHGSLLEATEGRLLFSARQSEMIRSRLRQPADVTESLVRTGD